MKAVIFDFDGTLTEKQGNLWKKIWQCLGYDVGPNSYYKKLLNQFLNKQLAYEDWCKLSLKAYQEKGFNKQNLDDLISNMKLMNGAEELIKYIHSQEIEMHIVSGNILSVIEKVLGENKTYFTSIQANEFVFDQNSYLTEIIGTKYDHEGKAQFIKELCKTKGYDPSEILFIGNSINDEWAHESGARTICVNPDNTKTENSTIWNSVIYTDNLIDLKNLILSQN